MIAKHAQYSVMNLKISVNPYFYIFTAAYFFTLIYKGLYKKKKKKKRYTWLCLHYISVMIKAKKKETKFSFKFIY